MTRPTGARQVDDIQELGAKLYEIAAMLEHKSGQIHRVEWDGEMGGKIYLPFGGRISLSVYRGRVEIHAYYEPNYHPRHKYDEPVPPKSIGFALATRTSTVVARIIRFIDAYRPLWLEQAKLQEQLDAHEVAKDEVWSMLYEHFRVLANRSRERGDFNDITRGVWHIKVKSSDTVELKLDVSPTAAIRIVQMVLDEHPTEEIS